MNTHNEPQYIYVFVRKDLLIWDQMVQVGHACFDAGRKFENKWNDSTHLVLLELPDEKTLLDWCENLKNNKIDYALFYEPDPEEELNNTPMGYTALCTEPLIGEIRQLFKDCVMWVP